MKLYEDAYYGIDISKWQGDIDFTRVKGKIDFAMVRAGYGLNKDKRCDEYVKGLESIKVPYGFYWFSYAQGVQDAENEASTFLETVKNYNPEMPLAFDFEYDSWKGWAVKTNDTANKIAETFLDKIEKAGYYAMIYTNEDFRKNVWNDSLFKLYDMWYARYGKQSIEQKCGIWQYSSEGKINGIEADVDLNMTLRNYPEIIRKAGLNHLPKIPDATCDCPCNCCKACKCQP